MARFNGSMVAVAAAAFLGFASATMLGMGNGWPDDAQANRQHVGLEKVTDAVKHTIEMHTPGAILERAAKFTEGGEDYFEVWAKNRDGERMVFRAAATGRLTEVEHVVPLDRLPADVLAAVKKETPNGQITQGARVTHFRYEVRVNDGGKIRQVNVRADGVVNVHDVVPSAETAKPATAPGK